MSDEMREARDKWLRDNGYYSKNEKEPPVERAAKALRNAASDGFQAGAAWQAAQPVSVGEFREALRLLWFFLPEHEPANPHSNKAIDKEKNKRWHAACEIYQKYAGEL